MARKTQMTSRTMAARFAAPVEPSGKPSLEKRWPGITGDQAADLLADLVFVMLMLLLGAWIGLWTFVH